MKSGHSASQEDCNASENNNISYNPSSQMDRLYSSLNIICVKWALNQGIQWAIFLAKAYTFALEKIIESIIESTLLLK